MSYQVLARKWRPRIFSQVVGQEHVLRALINGLDNDRLHHAYLLTGTRGVGKTTLGRILAKSLNCETGVSSTPCGQCSACQEIDEGRFVDLLEVDAASRTKVEDTRELLENVQYAPTRGRYKVYLIDEVHMLSNHSFNALLKTLEEPPPHIKFILATTDPQKLPVTILSRCLKFNLKVIPLDRIVEHLQNVLTQENISYDDRALRLVARAAAGSMRDALSLTDQAIAFGGGEVRDEDVRAMLGTLNRGDVTGLLNALAQRDGQALLEQVDQLAQMGVDFASVLQELISSLHQIALKQVVPEHDLDEPALVELAGSLSPEDVQLYYQIALNGQRDLPLAPDARSGFEMSVIRMLAFTPDGQKATAKPAPVASKAPLAQAPSAPQPESVPASSGSAAARGLDAVRSQIQGNAPTPAPTQTTAKTSAPQQTAPAQVPAEPAPKERVIEESSLPELNPGSWTQVVRTLPLAGIMKQIALNTAMLDSDGQVIRLSIAPTHAQLAGKDKVERLGEVLSQYYQRPLRVELIIQKESATETPAMAAQREHDSRMQAAVNALENDPVVKDMKETFDATVDPQSIRLSDEKSNEQ